MASPMTFRSWPPSEHRALRTKGSSSPPTVRTAASSSLSRFLIPLQVKVEQLFVKVARRLVFIYKGDGGGGKERLRFKLKLSLNKYVQFAPASITISFLNPNFVQMASIGHFDQGELSHCNPGLRPTGHKGNLKKQGRAQNGRNHSLRTGNRRSRLF